MKIFKYVPKAKVQYNDLFGSAAADFHESKVDLNDFAEKKGIDTKKYLPVSIMLTGFDNFNRILASILAIDKEHIKKPLKTFEFKTNIDVLKKVFKRFQVVLSIKSYDPYKKQSFKERKEFNYTFEE